MAKIVCNNSNNDNNGSDNYSNGVNDAKTELVKTETNSNRELVPTSLNEVIKYAIVTGDNPKSIFKNAQELQLTHGDIEELVGCVEVGSTKSFSTITSIVKKGYSVMKAVNMTLLRDDVLKEYEETLSYKLVSDLIDTYNITEIEQLSSFLEEAKEIGKNLFNEVPGRKRFLSPLKKGVEYMIDNPLAGMGLGSQERYSMLKDMGVEFDE